MDEAEPRAYLLSIPGITQLFDTRIFPGGELPQKRGTITCKLPALVLNVVSDIPHYHIDSGRTCYRRIRIQADAWANTRSEAYAASEAVLQALDGFKGNMAGKKIGFVERLNRLSRKQPDVEKWRDTADYMFHVMN